ncbi:hypothetical protein [Methylobacterium sp. P1-11]|uniref:hypothetical protein n=1 Tax=Methylobacterium sp. P1-11 TaxID=2024616 RepID=UPI001A8F98A5|nr:hypothetical protein [Methylobacterium sp. P1-11]
MEKIVQTAKQVVKADVDSQSARLWSVLAAMVRPRMAAAFPGCPALAWMVKVAGTVLSEDKVGFDSGQRPSLEAAPRVGSRWPIWGGHGPVGAAPTAETALSVTRWVSPNRPVITAAALAV